MKRYSLNPPEHVLTKYDNNSERSLLTESLTSLPRVEAYRFPKLFDLVHPKTFELSNEETGSSSDPQRNVGLFEGLLRNQYEVLAQDAEDSPEKYDPKVLVLLREILEQKKSVKSLSDVDRALLDRATLDFATFIPPKKKETAPPPPTRPRVREVVSEDPIPGVDVPVTDVPAYWWLK